MPSSKPKDLVSATTKRKNRLVLILLVIWSILLFGLTLVKISANA